VRDSLQSGPEKIAKSVMQHNFAIVGNKVKKLAAKCAEINW